MPKRPKYVKLPLSELENWNIEYGDRRYQDDNIKSLARSIQSVGLLQPIIVTPSGSGRYRVIDGNRRLLAYKYLNSKYSGYEKIPAVIIAKVSDLSIFINQTQEKWSPLTLAKLVKEYRSKGYTLTKIARAAGLSKSYLSLVLAVDKAPEQVRKAVDRGEIDVRVAYELLKLPKDKIKQLLPEIRDKPRSQAIAKVREAKRRLAVEQPEPKSPEQKGKACWLCHDVYVKSATQTITLCQDCLGQLSVIIKVLQETGMDVRSLRKLWEEFTIWYRNVKKAGE